MKKKVLFILGVLLLSVAGTGCGQTKTVYSTADQSEKEAESVAGNYEEKGFLLNETKFEGPPKGLAGVPTESDIVFSINNVIDGTITMASDPAEVLIFTAEYQMNEAVSGTLKLLVEDQDGNTYIRESDAEFAKSGMNTFEALIKTKGPLEGEYKLVWYIDNKLACEETFVSK